jgi:PAT family beta-lactamase induction signal transducer AmpG
MNTEKPKKRNPWLWVPSLYFAEGIPYVIVMTVSVIMYKRLGISNADIALYTSWLYLPWVIKPLWSPIVDIFKTKRFWILIMQFIVGAGLAGVALTIPVPSFFQYTLAFFWLLAFSSATHDIAADGFYMLGLNEHDQAFFVGIRSMFYRFAMITGQGLLIILAGYIESHTGLPPVEFNVQSSPTVTSQILVHPDSLRLQLPEGKQRIVIYPQNLKVGTFLIPKKKADSLLAFAKEWNLKNGFIVDENHNVAENKKSEKPGWWEKDVVKPLEKFLKKYFGPEVIPARKDNMAGNVAYLYFNLAQKPPAGKEIVVTFGSEGGDKSIALKHGIRFTFNEKNWNKSALAVIQLDPKLKTETLARFAARAGNIKLAWIITFAFLAALFFLFFVYHKFILPYPDSDKPAIRTTVKNFFSEFVRTFVIFFKKKHIGIGLTFILLYRLGESQLVKLASPFMLDAREVGGLGLTTGDVGMIYGTIGILFLTIGGLLGGWVASKNGLKYWLWWMLIAINIPDVVYVYLSYAQPQSLTVISACVAFEQFGYGFGFTAFMLYMIYISEGEFKTAHFALATGFMALGMMIPGMFSGWLQEIIGYKHFFVWVIIATVPAFITAKFVSIDPEFGKKENGEK